MTLTINGMTVSGTVEEIREMIANPPCKPIAEQKGNCKGHWREG